MRNADSLALFAMAVVYSEWLCFRVNEKGEVTDDDAFYASVKRTWRKLDWMGITDGISGTVGIPSRSFAKRNEPGAAASGTVGGGLWGWGALGSAAAAAIGGVGL